MNRLVIFSGLPGTGKSTLANRLARELRLPLLCIDDVIGEIPANAGTEFWDSRVAILLELVETQLKIGLDVIVDSVFMNMDRHHAQGLARKYGYRLLRQRRHFREWEPGTALFINSLGAMDENFAKVLEFVSGEGTDLIPLADIPLSAGRYHQ